jgi:hypothetical protein
MKETYALILLGNIDYIVFLRHCKDKRRVRLDSADFHSVEKTSLDWSLREQVMDTALEPPRFAESQGFP